MSPPAPPIRTEQTPEDHPGRLSRKADWEATWSTLRSQSLRFNPRLRAFADIDTLLCRHLPRNSGHRFLELGCCPGNYLWYFNQRFGYRPSGVDYLENECANTVARCADSGLDAEIIHADIFDFTCDAAHPPWDVVASFGLIEHFDDIRPCLHKHVALLRPGGHLVIVLPNHYGINGSIMRLVSPECFRIHNQMSWPDLHAALLEIDDLEILEGGYHGRLGFWNTAVYRRARGLGRLGYTAVRGPLWALEHGGRLLPNMPRIAPNIAVVARRTG